jgi:hypothetical protein
MPPTTSFADAMPPPSADSQQLLRAYRDAADAAPILADAFSPAFSRFDGDAADVCCHFRRRCRQLRDAEMLPLMPFSPDVAADAAFSPLPPPIASSIIFCCFAADFRLRQMRHC